MDCQKVSAFLYANKICFSTVAVYSTLTYIDISVKNFVQPLKVFFKIIDLIPVSFSINNHFLIENNWEDLIEDFEECAEKSVNHKPCIGL